ncbi:MAG: hypothetical protein ACKVOK_04145 [Flavobacteriales bacterium]
MIQTLLTGWTFMRWIRLAIGVFIGIQAIRMHDGVSGMFAAFFLFQAVTNTGCCGSSGCATPSPRETKSTVDDVQFEEVKVMNSGHKK